MVVLEPPLTRSGAVSLLPVDSPHREREPVVVGPRYMRSSGQSRWHRTRSGVRYNDGRVAWSLWCGQAMHRGKEYVTAEQVLDGVQVCGTCEGRAVGAGQDDWAAGGPGLVFSPRRLVPPKFCPGSRRERTWVEIARAVGRCLICGVVEPLRVMGGVYDPKFAIVQHRPGPGLVPGCPFHAWKQLTISDGLAVCLCRIPPKAEES